MNVHVSWKFNVEPQKFAFARCSIHDGLILMGRTSASSAVLSVWAGVPVDTGTVPVKVPDPAPLEVSIQFCMTNSSLHMNTFKNKGIITSVH